MVRINELCAALWSNVDPRAGTSFIPADQSKNRRSHTAWLSDFAQKCLAVPPSCGSAACRSRSSKACLNHAVGSETHEKRLNPALLLTYQRYDYAKERRDAWQRLGQYLETLTTERTDGPHIEELLLDAAL